MTTVAIHSCPMIAWHAPFAMKMSKGLGALGIAHSIVGERERVSEVAILLGTSMWRSIEDDGRFLLVDRCSFGDTGQWVTLVWNGHGRRGNHCVPLSANGQRWKRIGVPMQPWRKGRLVVLAGQTESYSPRWPFLADWYRYCSKRVQEHRPTHYRPHPAEPINPTLLPVWQSFDNVRELLTLNSSVAVAAILAGVPTSVDDEGGMAWPGFQFGAERRGWLERLAWTQWAHHEIAAGEPIRHLFEVL